MARKMAKNISFQNPPFVDIPYVFQKKLNWVLWTSKWLAISCVFFRYYIGSTARVYRVFVNGSNSSESTVSIQVVVKLKLCLSVFRIKFLEN